MTGTPRAASAPPRSWTSVPGWPTPTARSPSRGRCRPRHPHVLADGGGLPGPGGHLRGGRRTDRAQRTRFPNRTRGAGGHRAAERAGRSCRHRVRRDARRCGGSAPARRRPRPARGTGSSEACTVLSFATRRRHATDSCDARLNTASRRPVTARPLRCAAAGEGRTTHASMVGEKQRMRRSERTLASTPLGLGAMFTRRDVIREMSSNSYQPDRSRKRLDAMVGLQPPVRAASGNHKSGGFA